MQHHGMPFYNRESPEEGRRVIRYYLADESLVHPRRKLVPAEVLMVHGVLHPRLCLELDVLIFYENAARVRAPLVDEEAAQLEVPSVHRPARHDVAQALGSLVRTPQDVVLGVVVIEDVVRSS